MNTPLHASPYVISAADRARTGNEAEARARKLESMRSQLRVLTERKLAAWDAYWTATLPIPSEMEVRVSREMRVSTLYDAHQAVCNDIFRLKRDIAEMAVRAVSP